MHIKTIISRYRRDFHAIYECEHCGDTTESYGYDDDHFHKNVIPDMACKECGKKADDTYLALSPRYAADVVI